MKKKILTHTQFVHSCLWAIISKDARPSNMTKCVHRVQYPHSDKKKKKTSPPWCQTAFSHTCVSWAWLTWGSRRGVELVESSADPAAGPAVVVPVAVGASPAVVDAPGAPVGAKGPVEAPSSSGRTVPSLSLAKRSWITGSPRRMWQRIASMDSAILPPYTFSGFLFHKLRMQLNAALMKKRQCLKNRIPTYIHAKSSSWVWEIKYDFQ